MAEPISIGASVVTLLGASRAISACLKRLGSASHDLVDLLVEVSQFEVVVQSIRKTPKILASTENPLEKLIDDATKALIEAQSLVDYRLTKAGNSTRVDHLQWARSENIVGRIRRILDRTRANLNTVLIEQTRCVMLLPKFWNNLIMISFRTEVQESIYQNRVLSSNQTAATLEYLIERFEASPAMRVALTTSSGNFRHVSVEPPRKGKSLPPSNVESPVSSAVTVCPPLTVNEGISHISAIRSVSMCISPCGCECHLWRYRLLPPISRKMFGRGYIEFRTPPVIDRRCTSPQCKRSLGPSFRIQYILPTWIAMRMIVISATSAPVHSPEMIIQVPRVLNDSLIFLYITVGSVTTFRHALRDFKCTPYDIDDESERSILEARMAHL